ncbi:MAG: hypothetical protein K8S98_16860 [Planctomycetes bacterium]|nr:hypothetical protein [Planctomycetota bacterium]
MSTVLQDLDLDAEGLTTVMTFDSAPGALDETNFDSDDGQTALAVSVVGDTATVTWNAIMTPSSRVRVVGKSSIDTSYVDVGTSDPSMATWVVDDAQVGAGWGNDTIEITFSGPHVQEAQVENVANWTLTVDGTDMDLTGSTFDFDPSDQTLTITTGPDANLHQDFDLAAISVKSVADVLVDDDAVNATTTGDSGAPSLVSVEQNLVEDEFGRVIDFTFDESMDPVFCPVLANFTSSDGDLAVSAEMVAEDVLRVTFSSPVVPGQDTVDLSSLEDAHGNDLGSTTSPVSAGSLVANDFTSVPELATVSGAGNDTITAIFDQAIDPDEAADATFWSLEVPTGVPYDLSGATFDYDLDAKTLTVTLADDFPNGTSFEFGALSGNEPHDVDGESFVTTAASTIAGELVVPTVATSTQNRNLDSTGKTVDVVFDEAVEESTAETVGNYTFSGGSNVTAATLLPNHTTVRLTLDAYALPGTDTIDVANVQDLAGNTMTATVAGSVASSDATAPSAVIATAYAYEGLNDDTLVVTFSDDMVESEVETPGSWTVESPVGNSLDTSNATVTYNSASRTATLVFDGNDGINLKNDTDFEVAFASMQDIGGNGVGSSAFAGTIDGETNVPQIESVWVEAAHANKVHVQFSEPCDLLDDLAGDTIYRVYNAAHTLVGVPASATADADGLGVELTFGFAVSSVNHTLSVFGLTDLAGNYMFPVEETSIAAEDTNEPSLDGLATVCDSISGEENDEIVAVFAEPVGSWGLLDPDNWNIAIGVTDYDISDANFSFDGVDTVTIRLNSDDAHSLLSGATYDLTVDGIRSRQGVALSLPSTNASPVSGDVVAPSIAAGRVRLDPDDPTASLVLEFDEAIDAVEAVDVANYDIGAVNPTTATLRGARSVGLTFGIAVNTGDVLNFTMPDLAGNAGSASIVVTAADASGPLVSSATASAVSNLGRDTVVVEFDEPVTEATAIDLSNYTLTMGAQALSLSGATAQYNSVNNTATVTLGSGVELDYGATLNVQIANIEDVSGNVLSPNANLNTVVGGDSTGADFASAFVNWRESSNGEIVDVLFDEDVDSAFVLDDTNWVPSSGLTVLAVEKVSQRSYRLTLNLPPNTGDALDLLDLPDLARNVSGSISTAIIVP